MSKLFLPNSIDILLLLFPLLFFLLLMKEATETNSLGGKNIARPSAASINSQEILTIG